MLDYSNCKSNDKNLLSLASAVPWHMLAAEIVDVDAFQSAVSHLLDENAIISRFLDSLFPLLVHANIELLERYHLEKRRFLDRMQSKEIREALNQFDKHRMVSASNCYELLNWPELLLCDDDVALAFAKLTKPTELPAEGVVMLLVHRNAELRAWACQWLKNASPLRALDLAKIQENFKVILENLEQTPLFWSGLANIVAAIGKSGTSYYNINNNDDDDDDDDDNSDNVEMETPGWFSLWDVAIRNALEDPKKQLPIVADSVVTMLNVFGSSLWDYSSWTPDIVTSAMQRVIATTESSEWSLSQKFAFDIISAVGMSSNKSFSVLRWLFSPQGFCSLHLEPIARETGIRAAIRLILSIFHSLVAEVEVSPSLWVPTVVGAACRGEGIFPSKRAAMLVLSKIIAYKASQQLHEQQSLCHPNVHKNAAIDACFLEFWTHFCQLPIQDVPSLVLCVLFRSFSGLLLNSTADPTTVSQISSLLAKRCNVSVSFLIPFLMSPHNPIRQLTTDLIRQQSKNPCESAAVILLRDFPLSSLLQGLNTAVRMVPLFPPRSVIGALSHIYFWATKFGPPKERNKDDVVVVLSGQWLQTSCMCGRWRHTHLDDDEEDEGTFAVLLKATKWIIAKGEELEGSEGFAVLVSRMFEWMEVSLNEIFEDGEENNPGLWHDDWVAVESSLWLQSFIRWWGLMQNPMVVRKWFGLMVKVTQHRGARIGDGERAAFVDVMAHRDRWNDEQYLYLVKMSKVSVGNIGKNWFDGLPAAAAATTTTRTTTPTTVASKKVERKKDENALLVQSLIFLEAIKNKKKRQARKQQQQQQQQQQRNYVQTIPKVMFNAGAVAMRLREALLSLDNATTITTPTKKCTFNDWNEYIDYFGPGIIEEGKAQLLQSMEETLQTANWIRVSELKIVKKGSQIEEEEQGSPTIEVEIQTDAELRPDDVVLLRMESNHDLAHSILAMVINIQKKIVRLFCYRYNSFPLDQQWVVLRVFRAVTVCRTWNALHCVAPCFSSELSRSLLLLPTPKNKMTKRKFETDENDDARMKRTGLNLEQYEAVMTGTENLGHHHLVSLINGVPGGGKSHTIVSILEKLFVDSDMPLRILVCCPSNAALDSLANRCICSKVLNRTDRGFPSLIRVGGDCKISGDIMSISLNHLVRASASSELPSMVGQLQRNLNESLLHDDDNSTMLIANQLEASFKQMSSHRGNLLQQRQSYLESARIVFSTLSSAGNANIWGRTLTPFDVLIIDEAAQCTEVECLIPFALMSSRPKRVILVGDDKQLPATLLSSEVSSSYQRLQVSLFERLKSNGSPCVLLCEQYRMCPEIQEFPSKYFYDGMLRTAASKPPSPFPTIPPFAFYDISQGQQQGGGGGGSWFNEAEANKVCSLVGELVGANVAVVILSPYKAQVKLIERRLERRKDIRCCTVDAFQGQEADAVILSCVRTSTTSVGFLKDVRRLNVAITRAKHVLAIVGNEQGLKIHPTWNALIDFAKSKHRFYSSS